MQRIKKSNPNWQNPKWVYTPAVATDVLKRFKTLGWVPPSEKSNNHFKG
jgi:hypothetical protein